MSQIISARREPGDWQMEVKVKSLIRWNAMAMVVREKQIVQRMMLPLAISYDHRVINGGAAARFTMDLLAATEGFKEAVVSL